MTDRKRTRLERSRRLRRIAECYRVPNADIVLVVAQGRIVTVKRLGWLR